MLRRTLHTAIIASVVGSAGCQAMTKAVFCILLGPDKEPEPYDPDKETMNTLWKEGYGFGNPNYERRKQGLPPLNFGETEEQAASRLAKQRGCD